MPAHAAMSGSKTTLGRAAATSAPTCSQISAAPNIKICAATGNPLPGAEGGDKKMKFLAMKFFIMKFLALAAVIAVLVAGSAVFVSSHPRAMTACAADCD